MGIESATRYTCDLCGKFMHESGDINFDAIVPPGWVRVRFAMDLLYCGEDCARAAMPRIRDEQAAAFAKSIEQRFESEILVARETAKKAAAGMVER